MAGVSRSATGQKQTWHRRIVMSALPPKADIDGRQLDVRFVPQADSCTAAKESYSITRKAVKADRHPSHARIELV
jgi:hypothetical protein